ncbi:MAG: hypothetical protein GXP42_17415 [Chloroflexi bacterium]|nr:hypothetical protein [Chloroflexota bacterium]
MAIPDPTLHFLWLEVADLIRSVDYYRVALGLPVQEQSDSLAVVHLGNSKLYLAVGRPLPANIFVAIAAPDLDERLKRLRDYGVHVPDPIDEGWARYVNILDPDGYRLILLQENV